MMKTTLKLMFLVMAVAGLCFGCEKVELSPECVKGRVIGYDRCNQVLIIQIISGNLKGDSLKLFGREFDNVVQFPHSPNRNTLSNLELKKEVLEEESIIFFKYRFFDPEKDNWPERDVVCPMNIGPYDLLTIIITNYSTLNCPHSHEE